MPEPFLLLVTGGRDYTNRDRVFATLDAVAAKHPNITIIHGACWQEERTKLSGADRWAQEWAQERERPYIGVPAEWLKLGKPAGPRRNGLMLHYLPNGVCAFPGQTGTQNMIDQAEQAGVRVWRVDDA